ncbi:hypothetical protein FRP1_29690 (plasmid) [Pseudonocardia sp. EC080625-04]|uniref:hypothetical protein n=1 Tax=Pseudonocardia sp. EC080625-04 TaxID=1096868 RepID=UPI0006CB2E8A|nr:hypothetical protein [Pseudonocardia sp. EC080625-04]ALE76923.1 hypothetical protein FRP1_29690 [Pseudonocardia sp. EC080625-04]
MSGHRRSNAAAAAGELPPTLRRSRPDRRRAALATRFAKTTTDVERAVCAFDYFRGAASRRHPRPDAAAELVAAVIGQLIEAGDHLLRMQAREPLSPRKESE